MAGDVLDGGGRGRDDDIRMPFDFRTLLLSLRRYRLIALILALAAIEAGIAAGLLFGKRTFQAETVLRYVPLGVVKSANPFASLQNELSQVKLAQNLSKTRQRLALPITIETLGASIDVRGGKDTSLMVIRATGGRADVAADMANTIRDVYLESWIDSQVSGLERIRAQVRSDLRTIDSQVETIETRIDELRKQMTEEQEKAGKNGNLGFRYQQLRQAISEDQTRRANLAELSKRELDMERAKTMRSQDLISPAEYEKTAAAYRSQAAVSVDTSRIRAMKAELEDVATGLASSAESAPTLTLLNTTLLKSFDLELQRAAIVQKVHDLASAIDDIRHATSGIAKVEIGDGAPGAGAAAVRTPPANPMALREMLTAVLTTYGSEGGIFEVVAQAEPPSMPTKSTRRMVAAATGGGLILIGFLLILLRELLRTTLRSAPEARLRLDLPVLGVLPWVRKEALALPWKPGATLMEACRLLAERVHAVAPDRGARILVTSACRGEGRELVSSHLAAAFGMRGDKVVLLDAEVRAPRDETGLEKLCPAIGEAPSGLGDLLAANSSDAAPLLVRTFLPGVHLLGRGRSIDGPEPLRSKTMTEILSKLSAAADLVIVRAAPGWPTVDAGLLAQSCDAVVFVVRAERTRASRLRRALDRLRSSGAQLRGTVLVGVKAPFDDID